MQILVLLFLQRTIYRLYSILFNIPSHNKISLNNPSFPLHEPFNIPLMFPHTQHSLHITFTSHSVGSLDISVNLPSPSAPCPLSGSLTSQSLLIPGAVVFFIPSRIYIYKRSPISLWQQLTLNKWQSRALFYSPLSFLRLGANCALRGHTNYLLDNLAQMTSSGTRAQ